MHIKKVCRICYLTNSGVSSSVCFCAYYMEPCQHQERLKVQWDKKRIRCQVFHFIDSFPLVLLNLIEYMN